MEMSQPTLGESAAQEVTDVFPIEDRGRFNPMLFQAAPPSGRARDHPAEPDGEPEPRLTTG